MEKRRDVTIDIAKGIGIILVVFSHLTFNGQMQRILVHSFNMPLFFIISGYLFKEKKLKEVFKKGIKSYIIPAYILLLLDIVKECIMQKSIFIFDNFFEFLKTITLSGGVMGNSPLWFLPTIFVVLIIYTALKNEKNRYIFAIFSIILSLFLRINIDAYLWILCVIYAFPFYTIGNIIKKKNIVKSKQENQKLTILSMIIEILLLGIFASFNGYTSMIEQIFGKSYLIFLITGIIGTILVIDISFMLRKIKVGKVLEKIGQNTIIILLTHYYICRAIIPRLLQKINLYHYQENIIVQIILTGIILIGYMILIYIIDNIKKRRKDGKISNNHCTCI